MDEDLELLKQLIDLLEPAPPDVRARALGLIVSKYGAAGPSPLVRAVTSSAPAPTTSDEYPSFAELFHAANPTGARQRALLAAYWISTVKGQDVFPSQAVNSLLKDLGYRVLNITDAITQCMREKPAWIIQTRKSGSSKQARKEYKLTESGRRKVLTLISTTEA